MTEIDYSQLRSLTARGLAAALLRDGFVLARQTGSHRHYKHITGRRVIAIQWDKAVAGDDAINGASAPAAWPGAGAQTVWPGGKAPGPVAR